MSEKYINFEDLLPEQKITINGKEYTADELGVISIAESMLYIRKESPISRFDDGLRELLNDKQRMMLYSMWGTSSTIMKSTTVNILGGSRELAKEVLILAEECGIVSRTHNCQWRVAQKLLKDKMIALKNAIEEGVVSKPVMNAEEVMHKALEEKSYETDEQRTYAESDEEETVHNPETDESVQSTLQKTESKTLPKKKPAQKSTPSSSQKPRKSVK